MKPKEKKALQEEFRRWLKENCMKIPLVAWGDQHTEIVVRFMEYFINKHINVEVFRVAKALCEAADRADKREGAA